MKPSRRPREVVGWAKAPLRRAHQPTVHLEVVDTPPDARSRAGRFCPPYKRHYFILSYVAAKSASGSGTVRISLFKF